MIIYKDRVSGDEMFSDIYKIRLIGDVLYEVEGKMVTESGTKVDESVYGGNASAEGGAEEIEEAGATYECNIVIANRLVRTESFTKKTYQAHIKAYMKAIRTKLSETNPERVDVFKAGAEGEVTKILTTFKDWDLYTGESVNSEDAMIALRNFREDGITPYMLFWKDGLIEEKV